MIVLVTGSRLWTDRDAVKDALLGVAGRRDPREEITLVHGDCAGADRIAGDIATGLCWNVKPFPYRRELGRAGGPVRNQEMVDWVMQQVEEAYALAFHNNLPGSRGTKDCVCRILHAGIPLELIRTSTSSQA